MKNGTFLKISYLIFELGGKGPATDPGAVGLGDSVDVADGAWGQAQAGADAAN